MKTCFSLLSALGLVLAISGSSRASDYAFTQIHFPYADLTAVTGVSGNSAVGYYLVGGDMDDQSQHGFVYDGLTFKTVDVPIPGAYSTYVAGISGSTMVGDYSDSNGMTQGFIYKGSTFTPLEPPGAIQSEAIGISGSTIIGWYGDTNGVGHNFIYNGSTFTPVYFPGAKNTTLLSISGTTITGTYSSNGVYAFTYDGARFKTTLDLTSFLSSLPQDNLQPVISGISGNIVVGYYQPTTDFTYAGFVYDGSTLTTVIYPGEFTSAIYGITGNTFFGSGDDGGYEDFVGPGFVAQLQTPALQISLPTSNIIVPSWPYPSTCWSLQQNNDLTTANWVTSTNTVANDGTNDFIIAAKPSDKLFFRLKNTVPTVIFYTNSTVQVAIAGRNTATNEITESLKP